MPGTHPGAQLEQADIALTENQIDNLEVNFSTLLALTHLAIARLDNSEIKTYLTNQAKSLLVGLTTQQLESELGEESSFADKKTINNHLSDKFFKVAISESLKNTEGYTVDNVKSLLSQTITQQDLTDAGITTPQPGHQQYLG